MIMVQKPVNILASPIVNHHRRLPSAPPAVLAPGLLSISKPQQAAHSRQQQRQQPQRTPRGGQKSKPSTPNHRSSPAPATAAASEASKEISTPSKDVSVQAKDISTPPKSKTSTPASNDKSSRGRQRSKQAKDKASLRSSSHSSVRTGGRRRQPHHQGSPPQPSHFPAQAEAPSSKPPRSQSLLNHSRNQFDPFLSNSSSEDDDEHVRASPPPSNKKPSTPASEPKLASRPNGKLARRRQPLSDVPGTPTPSRAVPVPRSKAQPREPGMPAMLLSRSAPGHSAPSRPRPKHAASERAPVFPICDDMTDVDEDDVPSSPSRSKGTTWQQQDLIGDGPRTAPLSSTFSGVPFFAGPPTTPSPDSRRRVNHVRSESVGVFNLSFDEDSTSSASSSSEELKALVGLLPRRRISSAGHAPASAPKVVQHPPGFFASSTFQNSPSPDDLPAPLF